VVGRPAVDLSFVHWGFGVDIFFVISGFIMVYTSVDLFGRPGAWRIFLTRRLTRIVPLYWLLTTASAGRGARRAAPAQRPDRRLAACSGILSVHPELARPGRNPPGHGAGLDAEHGDVLLRALRRAALALPLRRGIRLLALSLVIGGFAMIGLVFKPEQVQLAFWTPVDHPGIPLRLPARGRLSQGCARLTPPAAFALGALGFAGMFRSSTGVR
jgi:exopolysaccharide production protein ExoZ